MLKQLYSQDILLSHRYLNIDVDNASPDTSVLIPYSQLLQLLPCRTAALRNVKTHDNKTVGVVSL